MTPEPTTNEDDEADDLGFLDDPLTTLRERFAAIEMEIRRAADRLDGAEIDSLIEYLRARAADLNEWGF